MKDKERVPINCLFQGCYNPELEKEIRKCKEKCYKYNQLNPNDQEMQQKMLMEILGGMGENVIFTPPFWCDYGYNIFVGDYFYANHNLIITDGAKVSFGNHVFIAPNCCFSGFSCSIMAIFQNYYKASFRNQPCIRENV